MLPRAPGDPIARLEADLLHGLLDLRQDGVTEGLALVGLEALHGGDHAGHHERDQQDQRDVLDRALPGRLAAGAQGTVKHGVAVAEDAVHRYLPVSICTNTRCSDGGCHGSTRPATPSPATLLRSRA